MKEPILQDKRQEHIRFCKYCLELIERVTGSPMPSNIETSIVNLNKVFYKEIFLFCRILRYFLFCQAEVISQTKIVFNENELLQLIHNHLIQKGLTKTAQTLSSEANISNGGSSNQLKNLIKFATPPKTVPRVVCLDIFFAFSILYSYNCIF